MRSGLGTPSSTFAAMGSYVAVGMPGLLSLLDMSRSSSWKHFLILARSNGVI